MEKELQKLPPRSNSTKINCKSSHFEFQRTSTYKINIKTRIINSLIENCTLMEKKII